MAGMYSPHASPRAAKRGWRHDVAEGAREASREELQGLDPKRAFYNLSAPKKVVVMLGGPTMNLILALVFIAVAGSAVGSYAPSTTVDAVTPCFDTDGAAAAECGPETLAGPAAQAGIKAGDTITAWDGQAVKTWDQFRAAVAASKGDQATVTVERDGQTLDLAVSPLVFKTGGADSALVGVTSRYELVGTPVTQAPGELWTMVKASAKAYVALPVSVWNTARDMVEGKERDVNSPVSMVGIAQLSGEIGERASQNVPAPDVWRVRAATWLQLGAMVNIALWLFNLIPLLPLDGGHVVNALFEGVRRQWARLRRRLPLPGPADSARLMPLSYGVMGAMVLMMIVMVTADIVNPVQI
jgi:membrane-associated protease RseP (regulator of RpoE activity)